MTDHKAGFYGMQYHKLLRTVRRHQMPSATYGVTFAPATYRVTIPPATCGVTSGPPYVDHSQTAGIRLFGEAGSIQNVWQRSLLHERFTIRD